MSKFTHPKGAQILAATQQSTRNFNKAIRIAETTQLRSVLKEIAEGLRPFAQMLRLYADTPNAAYQTAEGHFAKAASSARTGRERLILEALANGLIDFNKAIQQDQAGQHKTDNLSQPHFAEALRLARAGRQRPVLAKFATGLQHLTQVLLSTANPSESAGWHRDWAMGNFVDAARLAQAGRQGPVLKSLALGLHQLGDGAFHGMKIF